MDESPTSGRLPTIAASIFVVCCLLASAKLVIDTPGPGSLKEDEVARRSDQRFAALKAELPQQGIVGYVGESGNRAVGDYYLAQYALAPLVVEHSPNHSLVVGNFLASPPEIPPDNLRLVKDFGNGVLLFASKDAR
jgi:hypothetical protein